MTTLDYLEKIDDTLAHWEDYFHGQEGNDVTEARANLDKVRKQLIIQRVSQQSELLTCIVPDCKNKRIDGAFHGLCTKHQWPNG